MRLLMTLLIVVSMAFPAAASVEEEARTGMEQILELWREGRFGAVYERTLPSGTMTKETFVRILEGAGRRPACCWEKLQDVSVSQKKGDKVVLHGRFGFQDGPETLSLTRKVTLVREDGLWKMNMSDAVAMAGGKGSGRRSGHKSKKRGSL